MDFKEILENWSKIKDNMPKEVVTCYNDGIEEWNWLLEEAPEEIDNMEDIAIFVEKVNENLPKNSAPSNSDDDEDWEEDSDEDDEEPEEEESEDSDEDKPLIDQLLDLDDEVSGKLGVKGGAYIPGTAKYSKATQEKYYKAIAPKISKLIKKKSLDRRMYTMIEMAKYHGLNQFLIDNGYYKGKYAQTTAEILAEEKPKPDKPKPTKDKDKDKPKPDKDKDKPKNTKPKTPKAPEVDTSKALPHWHRILKTYANWAGNDKDLNYVQKYLLDIQGSCDSKLKRKTPFVEVIQKIHDNILAAYNKAFSNGDKKITIPKTYLNEVTECFKKAKVGKSRTLKMENFKETTLSGNNDDYLFYCEDVKKKVLSGYETEFDLLYDDLDDAKKSAKKLKKGESIYMNLDGREISVYHNEDGSWSNDYDDETTDTLDDLWDDVEYIVNQWKEDMEYDDDGRSYGRPSYKYLRGTEGVEKKKALADDDGVAYTPTHTINSRKTNNYSNYGFMTPREIIGSKTQKLPFSGKWALWLGLPKPNFHMVVSGQPGFGKSTLTKQFAGYLAENFGRVAYFSDEEDVAQVKEEMLRIGKESFIENHNMLTCVQDPDTKGKITFQTIRKLLKSGNFQFWFVDSLQSVGIDDKELAQLYEEFPHMGTVAISRETKNGKARGDQNKEYNDDITIRFEVPGLAKTIKNRFAKLGKLVVFEPEDTEDEEDY